MEKTSNRYCSKCYWVGKTGSNTCYCERYIRLGYGHRRGCPVGYCDKFLKKNPTMEELIENAEKGKSNDNR